MLWFDVESKYEATDEIELMYELRCGLMQNQNMKQQNIVPPPPPLVLWFDVESKYEATDRHCERKLFPLWFDVESKYEATKPCCTICRFSCGLMQNQNMKQLGDFFPKDIECCGLMQNQNMKQPSRPQRCKTLLLWFDVESKYEATKGSTAHAGRGCGLMQNQNMKQPASEKPVTDVVVV